MLEKMVMSLVIPFVFRQLAKYKAAIDWKIVQNDINKKVEEIFPKALQSSVEDLVSASLKAIQVALSQDDAFKTIIQAIIEKNWQIAFDSLKNIVLSSVGLLADNDAAKAKELFSHLA